MAKRKKVAPLLAPALEPKNVEALAAAARQRRTMECERAMMLALNPILAKYRCRLGTIQEVVDGRPGPTRIVVIAND